MQRWLLVLLAGLLVCASVAPVSGVPTANEPFSPGQSLTADQCTFPFETTDGTGTTVNLSEEPERVVTLNPSTAQTMWEIGAEEKVVGLTKHAMNLDGAEKRTNISTDGQTINPEAVVALEPDLVLAPSSQMVTEELVEVLRNAGLTVYYYPSAESIDDVRERTRLTGQLVGECEGAAETVAWMDEELAVVEAAVDGHERPDVLYTFFGYTAGSDTFIHEIIEASGGTNVAAELGIAEYEPVNEEMVIEENPDWIVLNTNSPDLPDSPAYDETTAVRENQTVVIDINHLNRPAPRIVYAITELAQTFHPEAYADARASTEATETPAETTDTSTETATPAAPDAPDDLPGFGALAALAALIGGLLAAKRRSERSEEPKP
ncbi:PGF-CTERM-anchored ABC transporter substrate-binding protein [Natronomonas salsuginis]|jgi:iron complex transport system substrate-binding protein|uniref:ABC transporter substrate-binding protein n=1 Tax=Natronomonas salsuginis TaxID=2217661 RepID=A0A4U5JAP0_9EURY|nr:PGF-CTERM-anchored ABC transporter substrate-binding protein [Natronomonas salsuginis]TKR25864.1 ABC transporter substrate-binding protein [Natronomonas salsuginis]